MNKFLQMRSLLSAALSFILVFLTGCQDELVMQVESESPTTFTATIDMDEQTKTILGEKDGRGERSVMWSSDDAIAVGKGTYRVKTGAGTAFATFTGGGATRDTDGKYHAYYPASLFEKGYLYLPEVQTYIPGRIDHLPMYAESDDTDLTFVNLCSVLQFDLICSEPMTVGKIVVTDRSFRNLSGVFKLSWDSERNLVMTPSSTGKNILTLDCSTNGGIALGAESTSFFVAIPAREFGSMNVKIYDMEDQLVCEFNNKKTMNLERSTIYEVEKDFVSSMSFIIQTDAENRALSLPFSGIFPAKLKIDWGDGTTTVYPAGTDSKTLEPHLYDASFDGIPTTVTLTAIGMDVYGKQLPALTSSDSFKKMLREVNEPLLSSNNLWYAFYRCQNLTSVCSDLFVNNPNASFKSTFSYCTGLTEIPEDLFACTPGASSFESTFEGCTGLTAIPGNMFAQCPEVTSFRSTFSGCTGLTEIPAELFANCQKVKDFWSTFYNCTGLRGEIPSSLFDGKTEVTTFARTFYNCNGLTGEIPPDLFADCSKAVSFWATFYDCRGLTGSIPSTLFSGCTDAVSFEQLFYRCYGLQGSLPEDLFANNTAATNFRQVFAGCTGLSGEIPSNLFANNTGATRFDQVFWGCTGLTGEIPADLFANNPQVTDFFATFAGCSGLTGEIPEALFANCPKVTRFTRTFGGCTGLSGEIPGTLFASNPEVTDFSDAFRACSGLTAISPDLFKHNTAATNFYTTFCDCTGLESIPPGLFDNCLAVTYFWGTFKGCTKLETIPPALFEKNTAATTFSSVFADCSSLTEIPEELFKYNTAVTEFIGSFQRCGSLTEIPEDLFKYNSAVTSFKAVFERCEKVESIPANLFSVSKHPNVENFQRAFQFCHAVTGTVPELWNWYPSALGDGCYMLSFDTASSARQVTNYNDIPANWKNYFNS